jgi:hypothetical protein
VIHIEDLISDVIITKAVSYVPPKKVVNGINFATIQEKASLYTKGCNIIAKLIWIIKDAKWRRLQYQPLLMISFFNLQK